MVDGEGKLGKTSSELALHLSDFSPQEILRMLELLTIWGTFVGVSACEVQRCGQALFMI